MLSNSNETVFQADKLLPKSILGPDFQKLSQVPDYPKIDTSWTLFSRTRQDWWLFQGQWKWKLECLIDALSRIWGHGAVSDWIIMH
jgi:hypothetical protein